MKEEMLKQLNDLYTELEYETDEEYKKRLKIKIKNLEKKLEED